MITHCRPGSCPEDLGDDTHVRIRRCHQTVEGLRVAQQLGSVALGSLVDPRPIVARAERHQQGSAGPQNRLDGVEDPIGASIHRSDGTQRPVHHEQVTGSDAHANQVSSDGLHGWPFRLHGVSFWTALPESDRSRRAINTQLDWMPLQSGVPRHLPVYSV